MVCVLAFVSFGHVWVNGVGNLLVQSCYYDCGSTTQARWYDKLYVVPYNAVCVARFGDT